MEKFNKLPSMSERVTAESGEAEMSYTACPECGEPMRVERVDNGVAMVWHGIHCGWGQAYMADEDVFDTPEQVRENSLRERAANVVANDREQDSTKSTG